VFQVRGTASVFLRGRAPETRFGFLLAQKRASCRNTLNQAPSDSECAAKEMPTVWSVRAHLKDRSMIDLALFQSRAKAEAHAKRVLENAAALLGIVQITLLELEVNP
jgi:hypothetical protein